jgi:FAD/FMN-containing dehydrogenase
VVLLRTFRLTDVAVDAERQVARVGGGIGCPPASWASPRLTAVEIVTADGELVRADAEHHSDLFWAVRGRGGSFGVVTALEFRLYPIADVFAGMMLWDIEHAELVLRHWAAWSMQAPDEVTTSFRIMRLPALPDLPDFLRGRRLVVVDGAALGEEAFGGRWRVVVPGRLARGVLRGDRADAGDGPGGRGLGPGGGRVAQRGFQRAQLPQLRGRKLPPGPQGRAAAPRRAIK